MNLMDEDTPRGPREHRGATVAQLLNQLLRLIADEARRHDADRAAAGLPAEFGL